MSTLSPAAVVDAPFYSTEHGEFLSSKASRLAEVLRDYNPYLELVFIPRSKRDASDTHPFAIKDTSPWRGGYIVRHLTEGEMDNPQAVLKWLFEGDLSKHGLSEIQARAKAEEMSSQILQAKRDAEIAEERQELAAAIIAGGRDRKNEFQHNGKIFTDRGARNVSQTVH